MSGEKARFLGPYRIEERLGAGGMGEVYRAYDDRLERRVAIKQVLPERASVRSRSRFRREARAVASLSHPAIVQIYDVLEESGGDWIVMEYVDGPCVAELLDRGPLRLKKALAIACDVAEGLAEAHEEGVVHRDLKTQNVALNPKGRAKILDFGLAKFTQRNQVDPKITFEGEILGTWRSMSPEQVQGYDVGPRSDLFSLGVMLYEMVTARSPFLAESRIATIGRILDARPLSVHQMRPDVPAELSDLIDRLLEKEPGLRPASARLVTAELVAISESSRRLEPELRPRHPPRLRRATTDVASTVAAGVDTRSPGERRQITVLSCSLGPSWGERPIDPEEQLQLMPAFERLVRQALKPYGGRIEAELAMTESLCVLFGYPQANADDARRSALGALAIVRKFDAARTSFEHLRTGRLTVRVGIHTGTVVVASRPGEEGPRLVLGEVSNLASQLRSLAEGDTAVVSGETYRLLRGALTFQTRSAHLPGHRHPIVFHRILEESDTTELADSGPVRLAAQVSRTQELEQIAERWKLAREGMGQVVLLSGEAGIGKTRLVKALKARLAEDPRNLIECRCNPYHRNTAFFPLLEFLDRVVAGEDWLDEYESTKMSSLPASRDESSVDSLEELYEDLPLARFLPRLASLIRSPRLAETQPLSHIPDAQKERILELLVTLLSEVAENLPVVFVVEDLQWCDPSTLDLLTLLTDHVPTVRMLIVLSFRRSFQPPWSYPYPSSLTHITLTRLHDDEVDVLIDLLADRKVVPPSARREIIRRADGIPLFVEELTRLVMSSLPEEPRTEPRAERALVDPLPIIPATLQGWLTARLDRLGPTKTIAQLAAALGREFSFEMLREVTALPEIELERELDRLVEAELLHRRGLKPRVLYTFKHGLLRDAAHESMLRSERKRHHRRIAGILERNFPATAEEEPELLAYHYTEADLAAQAVAAWRRAAENAIRAANHAEACDHARRGLQLIKALPEDRESREHEMVLQALLGMAQSIARGYDAPEVERAFDRARELWPQVEKSPSLFPILDAVVLFYLSRRGRLDIARQMAEEVRDLAQRRDRDFLAAASWSLGFVQLLEGDLKGARFHLEEGIAFHGTRLSLEPSPPAGTGLAISTCLGDLSWTLWLQGWPDQARAMSRQSLELVRSCPDAFSQVFALFRASYLHVFLREPIAVRELAEDLIGLSNDQGFLIFVAMGMFLKGQTLAAEGEVDEGLALMSGGLDGVWAAGLSAGRPRNLAILAEICGRVDLVEQGLSLLREASATAEMTGERHFEAEIYRLQGALSEQQGAPPEEVEDLLRRALSVARRQGAKSLELRAATSLCRFLRSRGRPIDGRELLEAIYGRFTEGFETADLLDARALLDSLGQDV